MLCTEEGSFSTKEIVVVGLRGVTSNEFKYG